MILPLLVEGLQIFVPTRTASMLDVGWGILGAFGGFAIGFALLTVRLPASRRESTRRSGGSGDTRGQAGVNDECGVSNEQ